MIRSPTSSDWQIFYEMATDEGWRVPEFERQLLTGPWSHCARVLVIDNVFSGLVTAIAHEQSGWIGNLIVPRQLRGRGYGGRLFLAALNDLTDRGMTSLWLTASTLGQPLYEKYGFVALDRVERWVSPHRDPACTNHSTQTVTEQTMHEFDHRAWGEKRQPLLNQLSTNSRFFCCDDSAAFLQKGTDVQIIGPWYSQSVCPRANRQLLQQMLAAATPDVEVVADLLASSPLRQLLVAAGFIKTGDVALMVRDGSNTADLSMMVSLASLGSLG